MPARAKGARRGSGPAAWWIRRGMGQGRCAASGASRWLCQARRPSAGVCRWRHARRCRGREARACSPDGRRSPPRCARTETLDGVSQGLILRPSPAGHAAEPVSGIIGSADDAGLEAGDAARMDGAAVPVGLPRHPGSIPCPASREGQGCPADGDFCQDGYRGLILPHEVGTALCQDDGTADAGADAGEGRSQMEKQETECDAKVVQELEARDYIVQRGHMQELDTLKLASEGKLISCFGNNAGSTYIVSFLPPAPGQAPAKGVPGRGWPDEEEGVTPADEAVWPANPYFSLPAGPGSSDPMRLSSCSARHLRPASISRQSAMCSWEQPIPSMTMPAPRGPSTFWGLARWGTTIRSSAASACRSASC